MSALHDLWLLPKIWHFLLVADMLVVGHLKAMGMPSGPNQGCTKLRLFWRRLVGALVICTLVVQPLLLMGSQFAQASSPDEAPFTQLCLHDAGGSPVTPADQQLPSSHEHCLQCFAGAFVLIGASPAATITSTDRNFSTSRQSTRAVRLPSASPYSIARPRGPPLSA
jgi:hypothetical protein